MHQLCSILVIDKQRIPLNEAIDQQQEGSFESCTVFDNLSPVTGIVSINLKVLRLRSLIGGGTLFQCGDSESL